MAQATYDVTASFSCAEDGLVGFAVVADPTARLVPLVQLRVGGALLRALYENWSGMAQDAISAGTPGNALPALPAQFRLSLIPALAGQPLWPGDDAGTTYAWLIADQSGDGARDPDLLDCVCIDPGYIGSTPGCPTIKAWCEALGGTYTAL